MLSSVTENALNNGIISRAQKFLEDARGKVAQEMSTRFGGQVGEKVSGVISKAEQAEALPTRQLEAATKAQAELASREPVAAARQAAREKQVSSSLDTLSTEKGVLPEDLGGVIQQTGRKNIEGLKEARTKQAITETKDPAFRAAREREAGGDFISNNQASAGEFNNVIKKINTEIERTPEPYRNTLKTRLQAMLGTERKLTPEEAKMEEFKAGFTPGYQPKTSVAEPMTMDQAEFLRRMLEKNDLGKVEGFEALDATRMSSIAKDLRSAMNKYDDRFGEYLRKYKEGSEDITKAVSGRGKRLTDVDMANEENALFSADKKAATNYYLDGSQERAQRLLDLTGGKTPEVMNSVKGYIRSEMEGMNAKQASDFVKKHEGMLREFPELRQPMEGIVSSKSVAETAGVSAEKRAVEAGKRLEARVKLSERSIDEQQKVVQQYGSLRNKLETAIDSNKPQQVISTSKQIADNLLADKQISLKDHKELLGKISDIEAKYGKTKKAQEMIKKATYKTLGYGLVGVAGLEAGKSLLGD
jgi:hypothetical protein